MHSSTAFGDVRDPDRYYYDPAMTYQMHQTYDGNWTPMDSALYNFHFDQHQKQVNPDYNQFHIPTTSYSTSTIHMAEAVAQNGFVAGWATPLDPYQNLRYDSPSGHTGGTVSESSSEYTFSPEITRQQMTIASARYISPSAESQFSQQNWTTTGSFMLTPTSTPLNVQTPSIAMEELEIPGNPEFQLDPQEDDIRTQLPVNPPEELEISENIATFTTSNRANTVLSNQSNYETDSSVSTPAIDNDSDSDFDPKRKSSRTSVGTKHLNIRSPRRTSSSYPTIDSNNRIHKQLHARSNTIKEKSKFKPPQQTNSTSNTGANTKLPKSFPCTFHAFGCSSTFANKNEWKRHVTSQHLQLGFYRCDLGICNPNNTSQAQVHQPNGANQGNRGRGHNKRRSISAGSSQTSFDDTLEDTCVYNDFNRKDLFTQHCRRMHGPARHTLDNTTLTNQAINARFRAQGRKPPNGPGKILATKDDEAAFEEELETIRVRCWTLRRHAPERSSCGFCSKLFDASAHAGPHDPEGKAEERAWEERMEHLGKHYERDGCLPDSENIDPNLLEWGLQEGILCEIDGVGPWLAGYDISNKSAKDTNGENMADSSQKREGLRRRGPRRRAEIVALPRRSVDVGNDDDGSDADAMADLE